MLVVRGSRRALVDRTGLIAFATRGESVIRYRYGHHHRSRRRQRSNALDDEVRTGSTPSGAAGPR
jgi:hypothetical protein